MKIKITLLATMLIVGSMASSCMTTKTPVGAYKETSGQVYKYSRTKQLWLFWGILPIGRSSCSTPASGVCEVVTRFNITDALISALTGGILTSYTVRVNAKK